MSPTKQPEARIMNQSLEALQRKLTELDTGKPAVFVDRDGTLNAERGYLRRVAEVELLPAVGEALRSLNKMKIPVIVISNQSALGRGLMTLPELEAVNEALWIALQRNMAYYDAFYYCPHQPDSSAPCECRKPQPGLLLQAAVDLGLDLSRSYMIGDKASDIEAGQACGCQSILVLTGWGKDTCQSLISTDSPAYIAPSLLEACEWILGKL